MTRECRLSAFAALGLAGVAVSLLPGPALARDPVRTSIAPSVPRTAPAHRAAAQAALDALPIRFEHNRGQTEPSVRFLARAKGYALFLTEREAIFAPAKGSGIRLRFGRANPRPQIVGRERLEGHTNYLVGERSEWHVGIPAFAEVVYRGLYPGIDLVFHTKEGKLAYDFLLASGADPSRITLEWVGARSLKIAGPGDLTLSTPEGVLHNADLRVFQPDGTRQRMVRGSFARRGESAVRFAVGPYDRTLPLVIDPVLSYSTYLGGSGFDEGWAIAEEGRYAYVTGQTNSTDFPTTSGAFQTSHSGGSIAFVTKLNASGTGLFYSTYLGGSGGENGEGIAVRNGYAYVTGLTGSTNFPTTSGAFQTDQGGVDAFVSKLNTSGTGLSYSTYLGGSGNDQGHGIAVERDRAYLVGFTNSTGFPTTTGALQTSYQGGGDAFVTKLNALGTGVSYSTYLGGSSVDNGYEIAVEQSRAYVTGRTGSTNFPTTSGAFQTDQGLDDLYVSKLNPTGTGLSYSTYLGGSGFDVGFGIAVEGRYAYVTGETLSTNFPTTSGAFQTSHQGGVADAFVTKLNTLGTGLSYSTYLGGSSVDTGYGIAVARGRAHVTGRAYSTDFPITSDAFQTNNQGDAEAFLTKLNTLGTGLSYSTYLGGSGFDHGLGIAVEHIRAYVTGRTESPSFPTTTGAFQTNNQGAADVFVARFDL